MRKSMMTFVLLMMSMLTFAASKNDSTVVYTTMPQMHCANCEAKIKGNLRFEKGVKDIKTNVEAQTVSVTYNPKKTTKEKICKGFEKFGYKARVLKPGEKVEKMTSKGGMDSCENM